MGAVTPRILALGCCDYLPVWQAMRDYTLARDASARDELWIVEHPPVYTLGLNSKPEHLLHTGTIPVVHTDRGGQVTYHGPGQVVVYLLLDLKRRNLGVKTLVQHMEHAVIALLARHGITAQRQPGAPGVYVNAAKIAALGLRVRQGCSYHGISLNVAMDLTPYTGINPCGYANLAVTQLCDLGVALTTPQAATALTEQLCIALSHTEIPHAQDLCILSRSECG